MRRAEVWWAEWPAGQRHPVLLLSWDAHGDWREQVTVAAVITRARGLDAEVVIGPADGMPQACVVNLDSIATIRRGLLGPRITTLGRARMEEVERALHLALGMDLPCQAK